MVYLCILGGMTFLCHLPQSVVILTLLKENILRNTPSIHRRYYMNTLHHHFSNPNLSDLLQELQRPAPLASCAAAAD